MRTSRLSAWMLGVAFLALWSQAVAGEQQATARPQVAGVIILGSNVIPPDQLMAQLKTRPGVEYNPATIQDDLRALTRIRKFKDIRPYIRPEADGRITVIFTIFDYPSKVEEVIYQGNKYLSKDELEKLTGIRKDQPLNPRANQEGCKIIVQKLNEDGRPFASCDLLSGDKPGDTKVIFRISEGSPMNARAVYFKGNQWASSDRLLALIQTKPTAICMSPSRAHFANVEADISKIKEFYKTFGFLDVVVGYELEKTDDGRDVIVTYSINEGPRHTQQQASTSTGNGSGHSATIPAAQVTNPDVPGAVRIGYTVEESPPARIEETKNAGSRQIKGRNGFQTSPGSSPCRRE